MKNLRLQPIDAPTLFRVNPVTDLITAGDIDLGMCTGSEREGYRTSRVHRNTGERVAVESLVPAGYLPGG